MLKSININSTINSQGNTSHFLLVVDSYATDRLYVSMLLQRFEYNIGTTKNAGETLEISSVAVPSLIITALALEDMSGLELIRKLRQERLTENIPVIIHTSAHTRERERQCIEAGAAACIRNPVQAEELYRTVQAAIEPTPRANIRITAFLPVAVNNIPILCGGGECATVLSEHGMYIKTQKPYPKKSSITVQITIHDHVIVAESVVLYSYKTGEGPNKEPGMGLQFTRIAPYDQEVIRQFINQEIHKGIEFNLK